VTAELLRFTTDLPRICLIAAATIRPALPQSHISQPEVDETAAPGAAASGGGSGSVKSEL
jgi:hypothetical protein